MCCTKVLATLIFFNSKIVYLIKLTSKLQIYLFGSNWQYDHIGVGQNSKLDVNYLCTAPKLIEDGSVRK